MIWVDSGVAAPGSIGSAFLDSLQEVTLMFEYLRFRRAWPLVLIAVGLVDGGAQLAQAGIVVSSTSRGVVAAATGSAGDGDSTALTGPYSHSASATGTSLAGTIGSSASQTSTVPSIGPGMDGVGSVSTFASATGFTGFSNLADSFLDVFFNVSTTGFYGLDASVNWTGDSPPYSGFALVELRDVTSSITIDSVVSHVGSPGIHELHDAYFLTSGISYRLLAEAKIDGGFATAGEYGASGGWSFVLVPEPSTLGLMATASVTLTALAVIRRKLRRTNCVPHAQTD